MEGCGKLIILLLLVSLSESGMSSVVYLLIHYVLKTYLIFSMQSTCQSVFRPMGPCPSHNKVYRRKLTSQYDGFKFLFLSSKK